jgi:beta-lactam-binding protein with PASTA domain
VKSTETKRKISGKVAPDVIIENDPSPGSEDRRNDIATAAYYKAESRGFIPGREMDDWLEAEAELSNSARS